MNNEEIEGILHLCRFLSGYQEELNTIRLATSKLISEGNPEAARDKLILEWPAIQGLTNVLNLCKIGKQEIDFKKVSIGIKVMLKDGNNEKNQI